MLANETFRRLNELVKIEIEECKHQGAKEAQIKKEKAEKYERHCKNLSDQRGCDNTQPPVSSKDKGAPPVKIDRERAAGKSASTVRSEVHVVGMEKMTPASKVGSASNPNQDEEMEVELEETLHDTIPRYLINLCVSSGKSPAEPSPNRQRLSTEMPELEDVSQDDGEAEEGVSVIGQGRGKVFQFWLGIWLLLLLQLGQ